MNGFFVIIKLIIFLSFNINLIISDDLCKDISGDSAQHRLKKRLFCDYETNLGELESNNDTVIEFNLNPLTFEFVSNLYNKI